MACSRPHHQQRQSCGWGGSVHTRSVSFSTSLRPSCTAHWTWQPWEDCLHHPTNPSPREMSLEGTFTLRLWAMPSPSVAWGSQRLGLALTRQSLGLGGGESICENSSCLYWFKNKTEQITKEDCLFSLALSDLSLFLSIK